MNLPILVRNENSSIDIFIDYWRNLYEDDKHNDDIYFNSLKPLNELTADDIYKLYEWKNGRNISKNKKKPVENIITNLVEIKNKFGKIGNSERELKEIYNYSNKLIQTGQVWKFFFLHILKYETCPIADIYVYKAFNFICSGKKISSNHWDSYIEYRNFFNNIALKTDRYSLRERKEIDEALWGFGKFLESNYGKLMTTGMANKI